MTSTLTRFKREPRKVRRLAIAAVAALVGVAAGSVTAQSGPFGLFGDAEPDTALGKDTLLLRRVAAELAEPASAGTIRLRVRDVTGGQMVDAAFGILLTGDGLLATKASEIDDTVVADLAPGEAGGEVPAEILATDADHDVALLRIPLPSDGRFEPIELVDAAMAGDLPPAATWLISVDADPDGPGGERVSPLALGNLSVSGLREIEPTGLQLGIAMGVQGRGGLPVVDVEGDGPARRAGLRPGDLIVARDGQPIESRRQFADLLRRDRPGATMVLSVVRGFLRDRGGNPRGDRIVDVPLRLEDGRIGVTIAERVAGVPISEVMLGSPALEAGLRVNDLITAVDDEVVYDGDDLRAALSKVRAGERVEVSFIRAGREESVTVQVGDSARTMRGRVQNAMGGVTLNRRASDFPAVLQHDSVLDADEMGGPVIDLRGNLIGMNIARAGRVETFAIPASVLREVVTDLRQRAGV